MRFRRDTVSVIFQTFNLFTARRLHRMDIPGTLRVVEEHRGGRPAGDTGRRS
ncbi:MAG TPA: hypothetical protein VHN98_05160 [Acidimicrobiales bacterium]|nr:hypothetical protein [Acidimicrobiales bacterium]